MVAHGDFNTHHQVNKSYIPLHAPCDGRGRVSVCPGEDTAGDSLFIESPCLCQKVLQASGYPVCAQKSHHRCNAVSDQHAEACLRHPGGGSVLAASACYMDMDIHVSRRQNAPAQVHLLHLLYPVVFVYVVRYPGYPASFYQDILPPQMLRRIYISLLQYFHGFISSLSAKSSQPGRNIHVPIILSI